MMEWSTTRSTGTSGSIFLGFLPSFTATLRMAAKSAKSGTPVKSCSTTRETTNGISSVRAALGAQCASCCTCSAVTLRPSQLRSTESSTMRIDTGKRWIWGNCLASAGSEYNWPSLPDTVLKLLRVLANAWRAGLGDNLRDTAMANSCERQQSLFWQSCMAVQSWGYANEAPNPVRRGRGARSPPPPPPIRKKKMPLAPDGQAQAAIFSGANTQSPSRRSPGGQAAHAKPLQLGQHGHRDHMHQQIGLAQQGGRERGAQQQQQAGQRPGQVAHDQPPQPATRHGLRPGNRYRQGGIAQQHGARHLQQPGRQAQPLSQGRCQQQVQGAEQNPRGGIEPDHGTQESGGGHQLEHGKLLG